MADPFAAMLSGLSARKSIPKLGAGRKAQAKKEKDPYGLVPGVRARRISARDADVLSRCRQLVEDLKADPRVRLDPGAGAGAAADAADADADANPKPENDDPNPNSDPNPSGDPKGEAGDAAGGAQPQGEGKPDQASAAAEAAEEVAVDPAPAMLVLCFVIIDSLPLEPLWRQWMTQYAKARPPRGAPAVRLVVHAKYPDRVKSDWLRPHLLKYSHRPEWGSVEIAKAMWDLVAEGAWRCFPGVEPPARGYPDGYLDRSAFIFLSESCFPIAPVDKCLEAFRVGEDADKAVASCLAAYRKPNNGYARQQQIAPLLNCGGAEGPVPRDCVWKADQWITLGGFDATNILHVPGAIGACPWRLMTQAKVVASDEILFPVCLSLTGALGVGGAGVGDAYEKQTPPPVPDVGTVCGAKTFAQLQTRPVALESSAETSSGEHNGRPVARRKRVTYTKWLGAKSPETLTELPLEELRAAVSQGVVFARKLKLEPSILVELEAALDGAEGTVSLDFVPEVFQKWAQLCGFHEWIVPGKSQGGPGPGPPGSSNGPGGPAWAPYSTGWWENKLGVSSAGPPNPVLPKVAKQAQQAQQANGAEAAPAAPEPSRKRKHSDMARYDAPPERYAAPPERRHRGGPNPRPRRDWQPHGHGGYDPTGRYGEDYGARGGYGRESPPKNRGRASFGGRHDGFDPRERDYDSRSNDYGEYGNGRRDYDARNEYGNGRRDYNARNEYGNGRRRDVRRDDRRHSDGGPRDRHRR